MRFCLKLALTMDRPVVLSRCLKIEPIVALLLLLLDTLGGTGLPSALPYVA